MTLPSWNSRVGEKSINISNSKSLQMLYGGTVGVKFAGLMTSHAYGWAMSCSPLKKQYNPLKKGSYSQNFQNVVRKYIWECKKALENDTWAQWMRLWLRVFKSWYRCSDLFWSSDLRHPLTTNFVKWGPFLTSKKKPTCTKCRQSVRRFLFILHDT